MATELETRVERRAGVREGKVIAVCYSAELINGVGKEVHESAQITTWGIPGDRHYGETRVSRGHVVPNNRPITVVGVEGLREACERLGVDPIPAGGLGENLLLEGLGDLGDVQPGDELHVRSAEGEAGPALKVVKQNDPCSNLQVYHKMMVKELFGKRGLLCTVLREGAVRVGDTLELVRGGAEV
ncbi:MAG: MOSC domain-containing protein [Chloroflexota bacterium]|nr:MOSC domain-containing protein [Chloroflexota bacterium]